MFRGKFLGTILLAGMLIFQSVPKALAAADCDHAQFVSDLTVPDGSAFAPGATFTKSWRLTNIGTCTWNASYNLVWVGGDSIGAPLSVKLPVEVAPGQMVDVSVNLTAPSSSGHYKSLFKISNATGAQFGIGASASDPFWADINVVEVNAVIYDFIANASYAQWKSGGGILPFPGTSGDSRGFAYQVNNPHLEDDSFDSSPGLLVVPQNKFNGYLQATYPEFQIQQGDHLQTLVNCEFGATSCYVTFRIDYLLSNGVQKTLWSWKEAYDKRFYRANLDLSSLAGQKVRFVLMLLSTGLASGDRAIWGSPRILRTGTTQPPAPPSTLTPLPALTPTGTPFNQPPPTVSPSGCDKASFVADITVPDGTIFSPSAAFTKTWRLRNAGTCAWTTAYKFLFYSGEQMGSPTSIHLPWNTAPGATVDLTVNMVAPNSAGKYRGYWILSNANGALFGIGANAANPIWVEINVAGDSPIGAGYDFTTNVCAAEWRSGAGVLPCPGMDGNANGFVIKQDAPKLEDGSTGGPGLLTFPQNRFNGYIQGFYPTFTVQPGDRFQSLVGCEFGAACSVTFRLDFMNANGSVKTFWSWREQNDKHDYTANVDLSPLAGQSVRFILSISANGTATNDRAIWGSPRIIRAGGAPPTTPPTDNWPTYVNSTYGFNFRYPPGSERFFEANNSILIKLPIAPGTNLAEKYLQVSVNENAGGPCQSPLSSTSPPGSPTETVVFNGIPFFKQVGGDAGMSQLHEWVGYSTLKGNACLSMDFVLHSIALGAYATPPAEFDKAAESAVFTQVMSTFGWNAPPPPTAMQTPTPTNTSAPPTVPPPPVVSSPQIHQLFMIDSANGWGIGNAYALRTMDGGTTWYNMTATGVAGNITGAYFPNFTTGWIITNFSDSNAGSLYYTTNGGSTWTHYNVPFTGGSLQFLDSTHGFVMQILDTAMNKQSIALYQTSNGGATWVRNYINDPTVPGAGNSLPLGGHKIGMTFRNTSTGWIGGDIPTDGFVYLYKTTNSGVTWSQQPLALPVGYESAPITTTAPTFFGPNDGVLPVWMSSGIGMRDLFLYVTHDGGATWSRSSAFARNGQFVSFPSVRDAFSWDFADVFHVSNDGGNSWRSITPNVLFSKLMYQVFDLDFISTTTGWFTIGHDDGSTSLYHTSDGGSTWTLLFGHPPVSQTLPDLTITEMSIRLQNPSCLMPGDPLGVSIGIKNTGQAAAGTFTVTVNGLQQTVQALGIGETLTLFFPNSNNPVTAVVDSSSAITESDETNNSRSEMVPVPTPPLPCPTNTPNGPQDFNTFEQSIVDALNGHNFDLAKSLMGQSFGFGFWQSQGISNTLDLAVQQLQNNYIGPNTHLTPDPNKDLPALLGEVNLYAIMGLDPSSSQALYVSGWGLDGKGEAILYVTRNPNGNLYWNSVLIAPTGFSPSVSTEAFCADSRIPFLIDQLRGSVNQSNGDMFAALVSPTHGVNVRLWAYNAGVNFNPTSAATVFTSTDSYNWGGGPSGIPDVGSFKDIIQPKLLEVLNAPNMETYCDNLTKVYPLSNPWPYPNIHYYNLYKPPTPGNEFDYRTWLIGFEYINNQPYLYAMVTIVWEP